MDLETRIEDLLEKNDIEDSNLIIVEDKEDTKKATIEELKKSLIGDNKSPSSILFYSTKYLASKLDKLFLLMNLQLLHRNWKKQIEEFLKYQHLPEQEKIQKW